MHLFAEQKCTFKHISTVDTQFASLAKFALWLSKTNRSVCADKVRFTMKQFKRVDGSRFRPSARNRRRSHAGSRRSGLDRKAQYSCAAQRVARNVQECRAYDRPYWIIQNSYLQSVPIITVLHIAHGRCRVAYAVRARPDPVRSGDRVKFSVSRGRDTPCTPIGRQVGRGMRIRAHYSIIVFGFFL